MVRWLEKWWRFSMMKQKKLYIGRLLCYNQCKEGNYPQSYSIELQYNDYISRGITFLDENI